MRCNNCLRLIASSWRVRSDRSPGRLLDQHETLPALLVLGGAHVFQQLALADHDGHQVAEVVGDPAGQTADRLHLLGLAELRLAFAQGRLRTLSLGDVAAHDGHAPRSGIGGAMEDEAASGEHHDLARVEASERRFAIPGAMVAKGRRDDLLNERPVLRWP